MIAKENKFAEVDETIVAAALAGSAGFLSSSRVELRFLDSIELCRLLKHDHVLTLGDFILKNELTGIDPDDELNPTIFYSCLHNCFHRGQAVTLRMVLKQSKT